MWKIHMETLMKKKKVIETKDIIRKAISDWYLENGIPEPPWRSNKPYFDGDEIIRPEYD